MAQSKIIAAASLNTKEQELLESAKLRLKTDGKPFSNRMVLLAGIYQILGVDYKLDT